MSERTDFPLALDPPGSLVTELDEKLLSRAVAASRKSPRKRMILPLHKQAGALLQRMLNAIQPGSYIRPHRHGEERGESIIVLKGQLLYHEFHEGGALKKSYKLSAGTGIDIDGGVWHSFQALEADTVLFEVKPGPYQAETDKEFAAWAPEEFSEEAEAYRVDLQNATTSS
ncbi:WbuC family cupin fold metalloprotein [Pontiellaceae bacterium B12227]|nr:WbuC family cupin fold metalloprotein [Pontiellaceae bacterium B12227]